MTTVIGLLIFDRVEELDFVGPWEVFTMARECGAERARAAQKYLEYDPRPPHDIAGWIPPGHVPEARSAAPRCGKDNRPQPRD